VSAPELNRALVLEAPARVADGAGGFDEGWQVLGTLWARIEARSGRETAQGGAPISRVSHRITVRGAPWGSAARPRPQQRFRDGARTFAIEAVAERDAAGRYLVCHVVEEEVV